MLYGEFQHNIDKKGRMFVPAKYREELGEKFMICRGLAEKPCLFIYSMTEWEKLAEKIAQLPAANSRKLQRYLYTGASQVECDGQGRILLPSNLREHAELDNSATICGVSNHAEIWCPDTWNEVISDCTPENIIEVMEQLGL